MMQIEAVSTDIATEAAGLAEARAQHHRSLGVSPGVHLSSGSAWWT